MIPGYRYRYPKYSHTEPITDTGFIPIFFIPIPIPGIGTWYRYLDTVSTSNFSLSFTKLNLQENLRNLFLNAATLTCQFEVATSLVPVCPTHNENGAVFG